MKKRGREINVFSVSALDLFASALGAFILMSMIFMVFFSMTSKSAGDAAADVAAEAPADLQRCAALLAAAQGRLDESNARNAELTARLDESEARNAELAAQLAGSVESAALQACRERAREVEEALAACQAQRRADASAAAQAQAEVAACRREMNRSFVLVVASWSTRHDVDLHVVDPAGREFYFENRRARGSRAALEEDNIHGPGNEVWLHPAAEPGRYRVCYKLFSDEPATDVRGSVLWREGKIDLPPIRLTDGKQVRLVADVVVDAGGRVSVNRARTGTVLGTGGCR